MPLDKGPESHQESNQNQQYLSKGFPHLLKFAEAK